MPIAGLNPNLLLRISFVGLILVSQTLMKLASVRVAGRSLSPPEPGIWLTPLMSTETWRRSENVTRDSVKKFLILSPISIATIVMAYWIYFAAARIFHLHGLILCYLAVPVILVSELAFIPIRLLSQTTGKVIPPIHNGLFRATSVGDFWGNRYNVWVSDWFHQLIFTPLRRKPAVASFAVYLYSGLWHDLLINAPLLLIFHRCYLGWMTAYFMIQWIAAMLDRALLREKPILRRCLTYVAVIFPAPLFFYPAILRIFGLWIP